VESEGENEMRIANELDSRNAETKNMPVQPDGGARTSRSISSRCTICSRNLTAYEVKFVLPSKSYGEIRLPVEKKLACVDCYSKLSSQRFVKTKTKTRTFKKMKRSAYRPKNEMFARNF